MRTLTLLTTLVLLAATAAGDIVYMRNGKHYEGKATRRGDKVVIAMQHATIEVPTADVIHIEIGDVTPETQPAAAAPAGTDTKADMPVRRGDLTNPDATLFLLMRSLSVAPAEKRVGLRRQIDQWRIYAHNRQRRVDGRWLDPNALTRHRKAYTEALEKARDELHQAKRYAKATGTADKRQYAAHRAAANRAMTQAATNWAAPLLRAFLLAAADLQAGKTTRAVSGFQQCHHAEPMVAAFTQGYALALLANDQPLEAVEAATELLLQRPDSETAVALLRRAMQATPGTQIKRPEFLAAQKLLDSYPETSTRRNDEDEITWLLPGKSQTVRDGTLPELPYDQLVVQQAAAVPVGPSALLVDGDVVGDALDVYVRIDEQTLVPANVYRPGSRGRKSPLALLTVGDYVFTAVDCPAAERKTHRKDPNAPSPPAVGQKVTAYGLSVYRDMGQAIRPVPGTITKVGEDGVTGVSAELVAGESAGPVITDNGELVGFLAARTDIHDDNGGPNKLIDPDELVKLIRRGQRRHYRSSGRVKRTVTTRPAEGQVFVVYAISGDGGEAGD